MENPAFTRLRWSCRRGMLELDVILIKFLENIFLTLSSEKQADFIELLNCTDPELFSWLLGTEIPQNPRWAALIAEIRHYAKTSH